MVIFRSYLTNGQMIRVLISLILCWLVHVEIILSVLSGLRKEKNKWGSQNKSYFRYCITLSTTVHCTNGGLGKKKKGNPPAVEKRTQNSRMLLLPSPKLISLRHTFIIKLARRFGAKVKNEALARETFAHGSRKIGFLVAACAKNTHTHTHVRLNLSDREHTPTHTYTEYKPRWAHTHWMGMF